MPRTPRVIYMVVHLHSAGSNSKTPAADWTDKLFADDIKIYMEIEDDSECESFQRSIDTVLDWANKWQLKLSLNKMLSYRRETALQCAL